METLYKYDRSIGELLNSDKLKYCYGCGTCTSGCPITEMTDGIYKPRNVLLKILLDLEELIKDKDIWLCASCYKCYRLCPQGIKIPEILIKLRDLAFEMGYTDGFVEALDIIKRDIPLPAVSLFICFDPLSGKTDRTKILKIFEEFIKDYKKGLDFVNKESIIKDKKIAIVGSGPAGLTAAKYLIKKGYPVTIFEAMNEAGGMLRWCIPFFRLPKDIVDIEIEYIKRLGVVIKTESPVTNLDDLKKKYDAIFVGSGAGSPMFMNIPGENLNGIYSANEFLTRINLMKAYKFPEYDTPIKVGRVTAVIGGGNVAMDASRCALRVGAERSMIIYRRTEEEMPARKEEVEHAKEEGVEFHILTNPVRYIGDEKGNVKQIECIKMELGEPDESGRRRPVPIKGSEFLMDVDTVVVAIGSTPDVSFLPEDIIKKGIVNANPLTTETKIPGIFAGGDAIFGPATATEAILTGKRAAISMDKYLKEED